MNRFKSYQHIFSVITFLVFLNHPSADWQARFSTLMEALLYPITRRLPQQIETNEIAPESLESVLNRLQNTLRAEKQSGKLTGKKYVALLEDGAINSGLNLMEVHEELRGDFFLESSTELLTDTLDLLPTNNPFRYLISLDIWQHSQNQVLPEIQHELIETIINASGACKETPQCMLAHARILMREGRFQQAKDAYNLAFMEPDSEYEYHNCTLFLAMESRNRDAVNAKLNQLKSQFADRDFQTQEKEIAFYLLDWETIAKLILSGYIPQQHEKLPALVALFWQDEIVAANKFLETHELDAMTPSESILKESPNVGKIILLSNLEPAVQLAHFNGFELSPSDLELLRENLPENNPIYHHLYWKPEDNVLQPLENLEGLSKLFEEVKSSNHLVDELASAFVEHPQMQEQRALELALGAIGKELPNSMELKARILIRLKSVNMESYVTHSGIDPGDTAKGRSLLLAELGKNDQAMEELKKVPGYKNSAQFHLIELQSLKETSDPDTLYQKVEVILERWPEFLSNPMVMNILFQNGNFDEICSAKVEIQSKNHIWDQYILSHIFTGKFKKVASLLDLKPTEMTLPPVPEPEDVSGFYHLSLSLWATLPDLAKLRQFERYRSELTPKIASDLILESQSFPKEIQTLLGELAKQYKTE